MNITEFNVNEIFQKISLYLLISSTLNTILAFLSLYLLMVLSFYFYKNKSKLNLFIFPHKKMNYPTISKIIFLVVNILVFARCVCAVIYFGFKLNTDVIISGNLSKEEKIYVDARCQAALGFFDITLFIKTGLIYFFLWIRQRIFYVHSKFKVFCNKCVRFISFGSVFGMLLWEVAIIVCYFIFVYHRLCSNPDFKTVSWLWTINILWEVKTIVIDLLLLSLFVFPLIKHQNRRKNKLSGLNSTSVLNKTVKKVLFLSVISLISDISVVIVEYLLQLEFIISIALSNISMLINLFAAIGCFNNWKSILCPCKFL